MYKFCAICGRSVLYIDDALCSGCYKKWGKKAAWVKALIKIERHNLYILWVERKLGFYETEYFDDPRDMYDEEEYKPSVRRNNEVYEMEEK